MLPTLPESRPTVAIPDVWNGAGDSVVYLQVLETGRWAQYGQLLDNQGKWSLVEVDLDAATATPYGSGGGGSQGVPAVPVSLAYNGTDSQTFALPASTVAVQFLTFNKMGQQLGRDDYALDTSVSPPTVTVNVPGAPADTLEGWVYTDPNDVIPVAPTYTDAQAAAAVQVDNLTVFKDAHDVVRAAVRNDFVFRTDRGGTNVVTFRCVFLDAGNYLALPNSDILNYQVTINGVQAPAQSFTLADGDLVSVSYEAGVKGGILTLRA